MQSLKPPSIASIKAPEIWLLGIATCLVAINLTLISRTSKADLLTSSMLFYVAIGSLIRIKRDELKLTSDILSSVSGALLIGLVLLRSSFISDYDPFLRIAPIVSGLGLSLLASGVRNLKQYWRELSILCFLVPSPGALALLVDISTQTAQFATFILWNLGFNVSRQGVYVIVNTGIVEVYSGCSGIESMFHLLGLAYLFMLMFPTTLSHKLLVPITALSVGFVVNGFRVALMAFLAAYSSRESLEYWHTGQGSFIFSMIAVFLFGIFCFYLLQENDADGEQPME